MTFSDASKKEAIKKLDNMIITVGNPDWSDIFVDFKLPTLENGGNSFVYFEKMYSQLSSSEAAKMNKPHTRIYWETGSVVYCNAEYVRRNKLINIYTVYYKDLIMSLYHIAEKEVGPQVMHIAHETSHALMLAKLIMMKMVTISHGGMIKKRKNLKISVIV